MSRMIYAIQSEAGPIKIGVSKSPSGRAKQIARQQPYGVRLIHSRSPGGQDAFAVEAAAHTLLEAKRHRGEWFDATLEEAIDAIEMAVKMVESGWHRPIAAHTQSERSAVVLTVGQAFEIDRWRRAQSPIPSRSEAVRTLVDMVLAPTCS